MENDNVNNRLNNLLDRMRNDQIPEKTVQERIIHFLNISDEYILSHSYNEQYYLMYYKWCVLNNKRSSISARISKSIDDSQYNFNEIQLNCINNFNKYVQEESIFNAYYQIIEFVKNNSKDDTLYLAESEQLKNMLNELAKLIIKKIDIESEFQKITEKFDENSKLLLLVQEGKKTGENSQYREISIVNEYLLQPNIHSLFKKISFDKEKELQRQIVKTVKLIILKYIRNIFKYSNLQENNNIFDNIVSSKISLEYDDIGGSIDGFAFKITNRVDNKEINDFFEKIKKELFEVIEQILNSESNPSSNQDSESNQIYVLSKCDGTAGNVAINNLILMDWWESNG
ncbi:MAG: hypothetical protein IJH12_06430 [Clostridia bacterium]|nr:hypothetical protein [Clostridia bacterium]